MTAAATAVLFLFLTAVSAGNTEDTFTSHVNFNEIFSNSLAMISDDSLTTVTKDDDFHLRTRPSSFDFHHNSLPKTTFGKFVPPARLRNSEARFNGFKPSSFLKVIGSTEIPFDILGIDNIDKRAKKEEAYIDKKEAKNDTILVTTTEVVTSTESTTTTIETTTYATTKPVNHTMCSHHIIHTTNVIPLRAEKGVLDLLFPPPRVKNFKNFFNSMKRMLSYTFK